jgi:hypothetical protein
MIFLHSADTSVLLRGILVNLHLLFIEILRSLNEWGQGIALLPPPQYSHDQFQQLSIHQPLVIKGVNLRMKEVYANVGMIRSRARAIETAPLNVLTIALS